jgi:mono/diheme cytochrome c family protein
MIKKITIAIATCALLALLALLAGVNATLGAQATSVADGVYTEEQAKRGATVYGEQCASCHGEKMEGVADLFPALAGDLFIKNWTGKSVGELYEKIATTMPALDPGSMKPDQVADVVADILSASKYPVGSTALEPSADPLKTIQIVAPTP